MIPNGLAPHVLFNMDGRQWIENWYAADMDNPDPKRQALKKHQIEKGWLKIIPHDKLLAFIESL